MACWAWPAPRRTSSVARCGEVRSLTDKPFGVDLLAATPDALTASVEVIIEEGASSFIAGLGVPLPIIERLKAAG
jgi:enoyl-[acyl-carrier protein] reductase II